jgi:predicted MFS family arabinose efflux permease
VAVAIAPPERRGRAVALVTSGLTVATVIGVPLGTLVGNHLSWRATFLMVAALGALALVGILLRMPRNLPRNTARLSERLAVARHTGVLIALVTTTLWALGALSVYTYLAIPLRDVGFSAAEVSLALLVFGVAATIGNMSGGVLSDHFGPLPTTAFGLAGMAVSLFLLSVMLKSVNPGDLTHYLVLVPIIGWGVCGWGFFPAHSANIIRAEPHAAQIALSLNYSAMYLGFAIGGALGGIVLSTLGPSNLGWVGGTSVCVALAVLALLVRRERLQTA